MAELERGRPCPNAVNRDATPGEEPSDQTVAEFIEAARSVGRPSLGRGTSPTMNLRMPQDMREGLDRIAEREGIRASEVARRALAEYLAHH